MITNAKSLNRGLEPLSLLHTRRAAIHRQKLVATAAKPPKLAELVAKASQSHTLSLETLEQLDAIYVAVDRLANLSPDDAHRMAKALLHCCLRLSWAKASGKPNAGGELEILPHKLLNRGIVNKEQFQKLMKAIALKAGTAELQECSLPLIRLLAW